MLYLLDPTWIAAFSILFLCVGAAYIALKA
jgi:hypothetical protein